MSEDTYNSYRSQGLRVAIMKYNDPLHPAMYRMKIYESIT